MSNTSVSGARPLERDALLVLTSSYPRWHGDSAGNFVQELAQQLSDKFDVHVLAPHDAGTELLEAANSLTVHRFRYAPAGWETLAYGGGMLSGSKWRLALIPVFLLALQIHAVRLAIRLRPAAIHAHWLFPQGLAALVAASAASIAPGHCRPRVVATAHGGDVFALRGAIWSLVRRMVVNRSDTVTVVSSAVATALRRETGRRDLVVASMGIDARQRFIPPEVEARQPGRILFVGRLVEKKGLRHLLDAMPAVLEGTPQAQLQVIGDGPLRNSLVQHTRELGIESAVSFDGEQEQDTVAESLRCASVFVGPCVVAKNGDQEGLGLVFAEAGACACPVVTTNLAAIRDVVVDGLTGDVVPQQDSPALATAITRLLGDADRRKQQGAAARSRALTMFDWRVVGERYASLLAGNN